MFRYIGLIWDCTDVGAKETADRCDQLLMRDTAGWSRIVNQLGLRVFLHRRQSRGTLSAYPLPHRSGVVLGTVFPSLPHGDSNGAATESPFTDAETNQIVQSQGRSLTQKHWGRYVAFVSSEVQRTVWVVKDPTGRLPCFATQRDRLAVVFSYMPDCMALGLVQRGINWEFIAARIALGCGRPDDTGIENVSEVCGGECLEFKGSKYSRHLYWNPEKLLERDLTEDPVQLAPMLRKMVKRCTHAWASKHTRIIHQLSGGLDSSIVASCLADAPSRPYVVGLTYYQPQGRSDERPWAKMAAQSVGCEHVEHARSQFMDFSTLAAMNAFASPPLSHSFLEIDQLERSLADQYEATAISSGDGGDTLFGSSSIRFSVMDYARRHGIRRELLRIASDVALLSNSSVLAVLSKSLRDAFMGHDNEDTRLLRDARVLASPEIREAILATRHTFTHPWFRSNRLPPGASEILQILTLPDLFYPPLADPDEGGVERIYPLLSQPLVELCVSIPSYLHFYEGRDRGLARHAFAGDVCSPILDRTWKDRVQGFPEAIFRANLPYFREILLDGCLVKERYLSRAALETTLSGEVVKGTASVGEVIDHVLVETWLRSWS